MPLTGRLYFTSDDGDIMGLWDSKTGSFTYRSIYDLALVAQLPLAAGPVPGINEAGSWMQLADGRMLQRIDDSYRANPAYDPYVTAIVWDADLTVGTAVGWTQMWPYEAWETDSIYIEARYAGGTVVDGKNWLTWQTPVANGEPQSSYSVFAADGTRTDAAYWLPYSGLVEGWGVCQVFHSDGFIYRSVNTDDQFDRYSPDTGVFEAVRIVNSAIDPELWRWHLYGFVGFTEDGTGFVVVDGQSSDLHPPAEKGKSPGLIKVYDHALFPWNDVTDPIWTPFDGPPVRYYTPTAPAGVAWNTTPTVCFISGNRVYFTVQLPEASLGQYPVGANDLRFGYDDFGNGLGNGLAMYSVDLDTWAMELEFMVPFHKLDQDGSIAADPNDYWFRTNRPYMGVAFVPSVPIDGRVLSSRRGFARPTP